MKKVRLNIQETLKYQRELVIEIPDDMPEDKLNNILDNCQRRADAAEDVQFVINEFSKDIKVVGTVDTDMSSPWDVEVEIDDFDYIK